MRKHMNDPALNTFLILLSFSFLLSSPILYFFWTDDRTPWVGAYCATIFVIAVNIGLSLIGTGIVEDL